MSAPSRALAAVLVLACAAAGGCVDRRIFITSEPSGARVRLNDQDVGVTPLEVNFTWFGTYDVRLNKAGYEPLVTARKAEVPLHEVPPFDLIAMAVPGTKRTHLRWHFDLEPAQVDPEALLERAGELRREVEREAEARDEVSKDVSPAPREVGEGEASDHANDGVREIPRGEPASPSTDAPR